MKFDNEPIERELRMRIFRHGTYVKYNISREEGLVLLCQALLQELCSVWKELFPECRLKHHAMSRKEEILWAKCGIV